MIKSLLVTEKITLEQYSQQLADPSCGGEVSFIGRVRNTNRNKDVSYLEFEAYEPMAIKEIDKILEQVKESYGAKHVLLVHRIGRVEIGEIAVLILANAMHRSQLFEGVSFAINTLKTTVPIWKKEVYSDGYEWISAFP